MIGWARAHDKEEVEPPSIEEWEAQQERITNNPALTGVSSS